MLNKLKLLALPLELYQREFETNLYLGMVAVNHGYQVLIGAQSDNIFQNITNGIYFHKDHANWSVKLYQSAKARGMKTAALDVEGLIYTDAQTYLSSRANKWLLDNLDIVFAWGKHQHDLLNHVAGKNSNIKVVGSPKIDVCLLEKRHTTNGRGGLASKILVNTRFVLKNSLRQNGELENLKQLGVIKTEEDILNFVASEKTDSVMFHEFEEFIKLAGNSSELTITIRPHPAENDAVYKELSRKYKNVTVDKFSDLRKQILSHDVLIHDGCTTAIEARALGKPVLGLRPKDLQKPYPDYANKYSLNFTSALELSAYVKSTEIENYEQPDITSLALHSIHNWDGIHNLATYEIVRQFNTLEVVQQEILHTLKRRPDLKNSMFNALNKYSSLTNFILRFGGKKSKKFIMGRRALDKKFPKIDYDKVKETLIYFNSLDEENTPKLVDLQIKILSDKTFLMYKG